MDGKQLILALWRSLTWPRIFQVCVLILTAGVTAVGILLAAAPCGHILFAHALLGAMGAWPAIAGGGAGALGSASYHAVRTASSRRRSPACPPDSATMSEKSL
jgi:hypothetical protein